MNLSNLVEQQARCRGEHLALVWRGEQWTWSQFDARIDAMAAALTARGIGKGHRVLVHSGNCNQLFESMFACFRVGAVWVPTNWRNTPSEVANLARSSGAAAVICRAECPDHIASIRSEATAAKVFISIGDAAFGDSYDALVEEYMNKPADVVGVVHDDPCWLFYTSGTTGKPKGAVLTHGQMAFVINNHIADLMPTLSGVDRSIAVAPLTHGAGVHQLVQVARGATTILTSKDRLDPEEVWSLVQRWRVSNLFAVPTIVKTLTEHPAVDRYDHSSLRYLVYAGAPMYRTDQVYALEKLGKVLVQYYGLGEVTGNITVLPPNFHDCADDSPHSRVGSCGYARTGMQISVRDSNGGELGAGETGEIWVCGPAVFAGYFDNPDANAAAFVDGWFRTGDLGYQNSEGFLYITGRLSDMYISGGSNIYPREIEESILRHPAVAETAIFGVPDPQWGEIGWAIVVRRTGCTCNQDELLDFLGRTLARYKLPKKVLFWDHLPKTAYGKVSKKDIRSQALLRAEGGPSNQ
jgi:acyl-CoA synthetase (AMP-forming)/AMP-acid ligase II